MKKYVATVPLRYGSKGYKSGDSFEAEERHGRLFVLIGKAKEATTEAVKAISAVEPAPKRKYVRKDQVAEGVGLGGKNKDEKLTSTPYYFRRDLTALDD